MWGAAERWIDSGGALGAVGARLIDHPALYAAGRKVQTTTELATTTT
ncbi:hypothetical protein ACTD5D_20005 [Nocardia takedensis]|nr:hypothetical protein [Nocardia takedensis]